jgi:hypothetical protein
MYHPGEICSAWMEFFRSFSLLPYIFIQRLALCQPQDFVTQRLSACLAEISASDLYYLRG